MSTVNMIHGVECPQNREEAKAPSLNQKHMVCLYLLVVVLATLNILVSDVLPLTLRMGKVSFP